MAEETNERREQKDKHRQEGAGPDQDTGILIGPGRSTTTAGITAGQGTGSLDGTADTTDFGPGMAIDGEPEPNSADKSNEESDTPKPDMARGDQRAAVESADKGPR